MQDLIPAFLEEKLYLEYRSDDVRKILDGYEACRYPTLRVNTLKTDADSIKTELEDAGIRWKGVKWSGQAFIILNEKEWALKNLDSYKNGQIYLQSLSSMIPAIVADPGEDECILDMTAAPGGKTTQMAALSGNKAQITACEKNKIRADRLRYNLEKQGASNVTVLREDARKLDDWFSFDKVLLDAPCSGSGTLSVNEPETCSAFSQELITRSVKTQKELITKALKILKGGHELIYSTCSVLREENEEIIEQALSLGAEIVPLCEKDFTGARFLPSGIEGTLLICPDEYYEGFFVAKLRKKG